MAEKKMTKVKSNLSRQTLNGTKGSEVRIVRIDRLIAQSIQYSIFNGRSASLTFRPNFSIQNIYAPHAAKSKLLPTYLPS